MAQSYMVRLDTPGGESEEVDLFELDLAALFEQDDVLISDHPSSVVTPAEALSFMRIIEGFAQVASPSLFDEFMEGATIRQIIADGDISYWTDVDEFVERNVLDHVDIDPSTVLGGLIYKTLDFERLASELVDVAGGGQEYLYDNGVWVRTAAYN